MAEGENKCDDADDLSLDDFLVHLFKTEGIDFADGDCCTIYEAVEQTPRPVMNALERSVEAAMPGVLVTLVKQRNPKVTEHFTDENIMTLAKLLCEMDSYPVPRAKIKAMESVFQTLVGRKI